MWRKKLRKNYNLQNFLLSIVSAMGSYYMHTYINKFVATLNLNKLLHVYLHSKADRWSVVPWTPGAYPLMHIACKYRSKHQNNIRPRPEFADGKFDRMKLQWRYFCQGESLHTQQNLSNHLNCENFGINFLYT